MASLYEAIRTQTHTEREDHAETQKATIYELRREASEERNPTNTSILPRLPASRNR